MRLNRLFDTQFVDELPAIKSWGTPLVVYVAREASPEHRNMKRFLETVFAQLEENRQAEVYSRLRNLDDKVFIAQMFELYVADFCSRLGQTRFCPVLGDGKTPDLLWTVNDQEVILDVATIFDERAMAEENQAVHNLLSYLGQVNHYFHVALDYEQIDLHSLRPRAVRDALVRFLDSLDPNTVADDVEFPYSGDGLTGRFSIIPQRDLTIRRPIAFAVMEPGREITPVPAIAKRIREKVAKYKGHGAVMVALCKGGRNGIDWDDVATTLFGPTHVSYNFKTQEHRLQLGPGGLVMPRGVLPPNNTSLVGVLYGTMEWLTGGPELRVYFLGNPFSKIKIPLTIPSYPATAGEWIDFRWSDDNLQEELGAH